MECEATYADVSPTVPYGNQTLEEALYYEDGWKQCQGYLTEGRYLVFEANGYALANPGNSTSSTGLSTTASTTDHESISQRWVIHSLSEPTNDSGDFQISSALDGRYVTASANMVEGNSTAGTFSIAYVGAGGYTIQIEGGQYLAVSDDGAFELVSSGLEWLVYSVTYH